MGKSTAKINSSKSVAQVSLHKRNPHQGKYDFAILTKLCPALEAFTTKNKYGTTTIDFANPEAVKLLNKALLFQHYQLNFWDIPTNYLCPPVPGRADYIHHIADLLAGNNFGKIPTGNNITCLDIGTGANCIYPIVGTKTFGWKFIASDIDECAIKNAQSIVDNNNLNAITLVHQPKSTDIFYGVITKNQQVDITMCNPPFHASEKEAHHGSLRKTKNLSNNKTTDVTLNFGGQANELWYVGGEKQFVKNIVRQSKNFANNCLWFTTLVSKKDHLPTLYKQLKAANAIDVRTINMGQGNKQSRIVAWTFLTNLEQNDWREKRWKNI